MISLLIGLSIIKWILGLRRVVAVNEVHIVQSSSVTKSFGKDTQNGNTYYEWPSWIPVIGITKVVLPVSNFEVVIDKHKVYDKDRLPLFIDLTTFFRISDSNVAAQRVSSFKELHSQLQAMVESVAINTMATETVEGIMESRAELGHKFETEMNKFLPQWGVTTVRNLAIKDIKDADDSNAIKSITEKRKSFIDMESRIEVAKNKQLAEKQEIESHRDVELNRQQAEQSVGTRTVEARQVVQLREQEAMQLIKTQEKITKEKEMEVARIANVKAAEINKDVEIVKAEQAKRTAELDAEAAKEVSIKISEGKLQETENRAKGIKAEGEAQATANKLQAMVPVDAEIALQEAIGKNKEYQDYLVRLEEVKANQAVGVAQAQALEKADIQIMSNAGTPVEGMKSVGELFTPQGGMKIAQMLTAFGKTEAGGQVLKTVGIDLDKGVKDETNI